jgi:hypothetical protein
LRPSPCAPAEYQALADEAEASDGEDMDADGPAKRQKSHGSASPSSSGGGGGGGGGRSAEARQRLRQVNVSAGCRRGAGPCCSAFPRRMETLGRLTSPHTLTPSPLQTLQERKALLDDYYGSGSCYGKPAAVSMLSLIEQCNPALAMEDLWWVPRGPGDGQRGPHGSASAAGQQLGRALGLLRLAR